MDLTTAKPHILSYDIPERPADGQHIANPSRRLRRIAIRYQYSCWIIPESNIPYALLHDMASKGATWDAIPFNTSTPGKLLSALRKAMIRDIEKAQAGALRTAEVAARLQAEGELSATQAELRVRRAERRVERLLEDFQHSAALFGIPEDSLPIQEGFLATQALRGYMHERAATYVRAAQDLKATGGGAAEALAAGAMADDLPVNVLGDALIEATGDMDAAAPLLEIFDEVPGEDDELVAVGPDPDSLDWYNRLHEDEAA